MMKNDEKLPNVKLPNDDEKLDDVKLPNTSLHYIPHY